MIDIGEKKSKQRILKTE
jgi:hypothetical protein